MLLDDLENAIKKLKQMDKVESANQDAEKKASDDLNFKKTIIEFSSNLKKISYATTELNYKLTSETVALLDDNLENLTKTISSGIVDSNMLTSIKQGLTRKTNPALSREWKNFHDKKASSCTTKINTIGKLAKDSNMMQTIKTNVANGSEWNDLTLLDNGVCKELSLMRQGIDAVDQLEISLNLDEPIKQFIRLVTQRKATIKDLNDDVLQWIIEEQMEDKFLINFKN